MPQLSHEQYDRLERAVTRGERVAVEQDRFRGAGLVRAPDHDGIFLPGQVAHGVPVAAITHRHGRVVLLDARDDFPVQLLDQRLHRRQHRVGVFVFGAQIAEDLRIAARVVTQPVVRIFAVAMGRGDATGSHRR